MQPLDILLAGNKRFVSGQAAHPNQNLARLKALAGKQEPMAAILCCSDSRLAPEIIFDQGIGDIFAVRSAGAAAGKMELASIEYAVSHLRVPLLLVMGHKRCGAVSACFTEHAGEKSYYLPELVAGIKENIGLISASADERVVDEAVRKNVKVTAERIADEEFIKNASGRLSLAAAYFDLDAGVVSLL